MKLGSKYDLLDTPSPQQFDPSHPQPSALQFEIQTDLLK